MGVSPPPTHVTAVTCDPPLQAILRDYTFLTLYDMVLSELYGKMALQDPYLGPEPGPETPEGRSALWPTSPTAPPVQLAHCNERPPRSLHQGQTLAARA